jgi:hypothetical protein
MDPKRELCEAEDAAWNRLMALIESLSPEQIEVPGPLPGGWSVKDLMAHLCSWQAETVQVLEQIRNETYRRREIDVDAMNAEFYEVHRDIPLSMIRAGLWSARTRMLTEWNLLPDVTPDAEEWFRESGPAHYQEHLPPLEDLVATLRSS